MPTDRPINSDRMLHEAATMLENIVKPGQTSLTQIELSISISQAIAQVVAADAEIRKARAMEDMAHYAKSIAESLERIAA